MNSRISDTSRQIVARSGSNLAFALALLPREKRHDMQVFYAFCRVIDDIADDSSVENEKRKENLDHWRSLIDDATPLPGVETEFCELNNKYQFDSDLLNQIIDGVAMDCEPLRFQTTDELKEYCYKVASAVGLISIEIFGYRNENTKRYAELLGYALQWTNIMRDVSEDADEGRIYLPLDSLEQFRISETNILEKNVPADSFCHLMSHHSEIARRFYREALENLPSEDRANLRSPELMRRIYHGILTKMENDNYRVFEKRYRLSKVRMLSEFVRAKYLT